MLVTLQISDHIWFSQVSLAHKGPKEFFIVIWTAHWARLVICPQWDLYHHPIWFSHLLGSFILLRQWGKKIQSWWWQNHSKKKQIVLRARILFWWKCQHIIRILVVGGQHSRLRGTVFIITLEEMQLSPATPGKSRNTHGNQSDLAHKEGSNHLTKKMSISSELYRRTPPSMIKCAHYQTPQPTPD